MIYYILYKYLEVPKCRLSIPREIAQHDRSN